MAKLSIPCPAILNMFLVIGAQLLFACDSDEGGPNTVNYEDYVREQDKYPACSADGKYIAYFHDASYPIDSLYPTGLYIIDQDGKNRRLVQEGNHYHPAWSPDGAWLVFSTQGVIQKCRIDGNELTTIDSSSDYFFFPDYAPNGTHLIFDRLVNEDGSLMVVNSAMNESPRIFSTNITTARDPEYSSSGNQLVYMKGSTEWAHWEIFTSDLNGSYETRLTDNDSDDKGPTWSPDGQYIAWSSNVKIQVMNLDGSGQRFLSYGQYPSWSVNNVIVFSHANSDYTKEVLFTINTDGSNKKQMTF